jgi:integrase
LDAGLSSSTVQLIHMTLHKALKQALKWGLVPRNVTEAVDAPKPQKKDIQPLTPEQARTFLRTTKGNRLEALYVLAITTGLRRGELLGLRWQDVDLKEKVVRVRQQLTFTNSGLSFTRPKNGRSRNVALMNLSVEALKDHRKRQTDEKLKMGNLWQDTDLVFTSVKGTPLDARSLANRSFRPLLKRAGLPQIRFHDLCHTFATLFLSNGTHPKIVQEMLA